MLVFSKLALFNIIQMHKTALLLIAIIYVLPLTGQTENNYRSANNPYYWKNRKPFEGYWQQDVQYKIKASIDEKTDIIDAQQELTYWNNSPDELTFVYFHLYQNAFQPGSYTDDLHKRNGVRAKYGKYESQGLGTIISKMTIDGVVPKQEVDNTILKVFLPKPLKSGESITFSIDFKTYFDNGSIRRRMKTFNSYGTKHFDGVHWYPRISVYDRKLGWDTDQHLTREFYGDYGSYDVELTFANNYIVEATGVLQNESEVLPDDLRKKLDVKNFATKPLEESPSIIITPDGTKKTWKYHAENVHDFAFTADPTYRIGEATWNGIRCIAVVQEPHASRWQNAASYTAKIIEIYSTDFGMYAYPKMVVADARDGMEYPMLTLDGGLDPDYRDLLAHEIGHNWFFGMIGSNETYRAALDEGFTQFIESWAVTKIDGKYRVTGKPKSDYVAKYRTPDNVVFSEVYNGYIFDAAHGDETTLNTHSDGFGGALRHGGGYRQVYMKTATMLYNLQYTLGDSLFTNAMKHYFDQWKICHPYMEDFRNSIISYTKVDLNWFFDEWFETSKTIDYKIASIKKTKEKDTYKVKFKRIGRMQMPIDFTVISKDSSKHDFYIPNNWFEKSTKATILPRWIGWDKLKPTYTATIIIPGGVKDVIIDPTQRLADVNMLNNSKKNKIDYTLDSKIYNPPSWTKYEIKVRPDIWYNGYDGVKTGIHMNGGYMNYFKFFDATLWFNTGLAQSGLDTTARINRFDNVSLRVNYKTPTNKFSKNSDVYFSVKILDGLNSYLAGFEKRDASLDNRLYIEAKCMYRNNSNDLTYLLYPKEWQLKKQNNTLTVGFEHLYNYKKGKGDIDFKLRSATLTQDYDYSFASLSAVNKNDLGKININTRTYIQYGLGSKWASESSLFAAGANPEEMMDNKYTRSQGFFPTDWATFGAGVNNFHAGGGLNLRGYSGYLLPELDANGNTRITYKGTSGAAINVELEFQELVKIKNKFLKNNFKLATYLFGDARIINYNLSTEKLLLSEPRIDAGLGAALTIQRWGILQTVNPLTIRFDVPFFLNRIPNVETDYVAFRWVIGVSRAF